MLGGIHLKAVFHSGASQIIGVVSRMGGAGEDYRGGGDTREPILLS